MTPPGLTGDEEYLLRHAIAMSGWLTKTFAESSDYRQPMARMEREGLFEFVDATPGDVIARYVITDAGRAAVGGLR